MDVNPEIARHLDRALAEAGLPGLSLRQVGDVFTLSAGLPMTPETLRALMRAWEAFEEAGLPRETQGQAG